MRRTLLKSKIHRATVTRCELDYEGSCAIDDELREAADIREFEQIAIYNVTNGERFTTYALAAPGGSGLVSLNGAAARKASVGDTVIIASYAEYEEAEAHGHQPRLVYVDARNRIARTGRSLRSA